MIYKSPIAAKYLARWQQEGLSPSLNCLDPDIAKSKDLVAYGGSGKVQGILRFKCHS